MRQITEEMEKAFFNGRNMSKGNTVVRDGKVYLHGNLIAEWRGNEIWITNAGWFSNTTKERLNAFTWVHQKDFDWYVNGELWDGKWLNVGTK
jgi:hypothetical protein